MTVEQVRKKSGQAEGILKSGDQPDSMKSGIYKTVPPPRIYGNSIVCFLHPDAVLKKRRFFYFINACMSLVLKSPFKRLLW